MDLWLASRCPPEWVQSKKTHDATCGQSIGDRHRIGDDALGGGESNVRIEPGTTGPSRGGARSAGIRQKWTSPFVSTALRGGTMGALFGFPVAHAFFG